MPRFSDEFFAGFSNAIDDIRQKVVEEPFFGRAVTEKGPDAPCWPEAREVQPAPERDTQEQDVPRWPEAREVEPGQEHDEPEQDIDRDR